MAAAAAADPSTPYIPLGDGWSKDGRATASCYCGAVQLSFPTSGPDLVDTFICNCTDCRKITASSFASNFIVSDAAIQYVRGREKLTEFKQSKTIATGHSMANHFCSVCGTLMSRVSSGLEGKSVLRIGTVDDFNLHEKELRPRIEQFVKDRVGWFEGGVGAEPHEGGYFQ